MLFLASMGETGLCHDIFFKFSLRPFEVVEVEWQSMLNFEAETSKFCNCSWKLIICSNTQACRPRGCRGCHGTHRFWYISKPYLEEGSKLCPYITTGTPGLSDLPTAFLIEYFSHNKIDRISPKNLFILWISSRFVVEQEKRQTLKRRSHFYDHNDTDPDLKLLFVIQAKSFKMATR